MNANLETYGGLLFIVALIIGAGRVLCARLEGTVKKISLTLVLTVAVWAALFVSQFMYSHAPFWVWCSTNVLECIPFLVVLLLLGKRADKTEARHLVASAVAPVEEMPGPNDEYCWMHSGPKMGGWYCEHPDCKAVEED